MDNPDLYLYLKAAAASIITAAAIKFDSVGDLLLLFLAAILLDYITGIASAVYRKRLSSSIGLRGVMKKLGSCFVVAVAFMTDEIIAQIGLQLGIPVSTGGAIAAVVIIWLILNELISILENVEAMHIALPSFLLTAVKLLKKHAESKGGAVMPGNGESGADDSSEEETNSPQ